MLPQFPLKLGQLFLFIRPQARPSKRKPLYLFIFKVNLNIFCTQRKNIQASLIILARLFVYLCTK